MHDCELYRRILGVEAPWRVERVDLDLQETKEVRVTVSRDPAAPCTCPEPDCGMTCPIHDHQERSWRHLDTCQYRTMITGRVPRVNCPLHGVHQVRVPWAEPGSRFTMLFECLAIDWLKEASITAVAGMLKLSWDEAAGIQERAVKRGLARRDREEVVKRIGVDEKSFQKRHEYVTVVTDLEEARVLHVGDDRKKETLDDFFWKLPPEKLEAIEAVAMDMWEPYLASCREYVPDFDKKVVFDKFHVAQHLGEAVNDVRKGETRELAAAGDERLKKTKYLWLRNPANFPEAAWRKFRNLRESTLRTARAWAIKEEFMAAMWDYHYRGAARTFFKRWFHWATHSRLKPIIEVARMLKRHLQGILNYARYRITNAVSEAINAKIQWVKYTARGFRNRDRFRMAIYFHCGALDLYPH
jgi:transposase